jgi:hypothetical protein
LWTAVKRKIVVALVLFVAFSADMFLYVFGYVFYGGNSVAGIWLNPDFWVGKRVRVSGVLRGSFMYIPEEVSPYEYLLEEPQTGCKIGLVWKGNVSLNVWEFEDHNISVVGVVKKGFTGPLICRTVYYIEAEETTPNSVAQDRVVDSLLKSRIWLYS